MVPAVILNPGQEYLQQQLIDDFLIPNNIKHMQLKYLSIEDLAILMKLSDFIIVPGLGSDSDDEAMKQIIELYPSYNEHIYQINIAPIVEEFGGAFNCLSWTVLDSNNY